jgi:exonuclease III
MKPAVWNANGLVQHRNELKMFLYTHDIDVLLISETHFTEKSYIRIPQHTHTTTLAIQPEQLGAGLS